jgi:hypothetical protein
VLINLASSPVDQDAVGPVAEAFTQEQCIALYPGSNPGRPSNSQTKRPLEGGLCVAPIVNFQVTINADPFCRRRGAG